MNIYISLTLQVKINGGVPQSGFYWNSADHNGVTGGCRSVLMYFQPGARLNLFLDRGDTYSDSNQLTSLSIFRFYIARFTFIFSCDIVRLID